MIELPIDAVLPNVRQALHRHASLVLVAAPGAGKTTRVPSAILEVLPKDSPNLIMLQPRRVAARAAAERIAFERGWRVGEEVGYHIRFEKRYTPHTRIRVLTEAILTRMLLADPALEGMGGVGCVILDEFHERNIHTDLALAFLCEVQQTIRPDLKILVMSATLDAQPVAAYLGGTDACPVLECPGRTFPVELIYRPGKDVAWLDHMHTVLEEVLQQDAAQTGDILAFLPGAREILALQTRLRWFSDHTGLVLPLHGTLSAEEQQQALRPADKRKVILATNIAETSLTIDGIRTVIDSGLARIASYDPDRGMDRLDLEPISQASATQRAGRAGRQAPGRAIRLWPEISHKHRPAFNTPEIHRVDLAATVLAVHAWGAKDPRAFAWFDVPPEPMLAGAEEVLTMLGALEDGRLTELGRNMLALPAHPRIARLLLAAQGTPLLEDALSLAAILSDDGRSTSRATDPLAQLHRLPQHLTRIRDQLSSSLRATKIENQKSKIKNVEDLLVLAYPDRIARRRAASTGAGDPHAAIMVGGIGLRLAPEALTPAIVSAPLFLALDAHHDPRNKRAEATVHTATPLTLETLERLFPDGFHSQNALQYDTQKEKVTAFTRRYFRDLLLEEDPHGKVDPQHAGPILTAALAPRARDLLTRNQPAAKLLARIALLAHHMQEHPWPALDDAGLQAFLAHACEGRRTLAEVTDAAGSHALADAIRAALPYPLDRLLDQHAPEAIQVPSGSHIKLEYALPPAPGSPPPAPILAVRLQELFGWLDTPRVAAGRVPVLLHLLSPGFKPMQITSDLHSFWSSAYFEVRKDLRVRYPKHKWPEDPLTATPEAKGRRRSS